MNFGEAVLYFALGYMFGSIPFGLLIAKAAGHGDIRQIGSGNIGATNALRTGSKGVAVATLLADIAKGFIPVALANHFSWEAIAAIAGLGAILGHLFPVFLKFKGGKGVATYLGVLFGIAWVSALIFIATWLTMAFVKKISSLAALTGVVVVAISAFFIHHLHNFAYLSVLAAIILFTHRENISRLLAGTESKIKLSSSKSQDEN